MNNEDRILDVVRNSDGYVTPGYVADQTSLSVSKVTSVLESHPEEIRKSSIETDGEPVFMPNKPFSFLVDAWNTFRFVNSKKF